MNNRKKWTDDEDLVVYRQVKNNLENMQKAFREAAELLGRSPKAVTIRWYKYISKQTNSTAFVLLSETRAYNNRKNISETTPVINTRPSFWKRILRVLGLE